MCIQLNQVTNFQNVNSKYLICVDDDLALLFVAAGDEEEVVERGRVVEDAVVLERVQHVPAAEFQQVNPALVNG